MLLGPGINLLGRVPARKGNGLWRMCEGIRVGAVQDRSCEGTPVWLRIVSTGQCGCRTASVSVAHMHTEATLPTELLPFIVFLAFFVLAFIFCFG